MLRAVPRRLPGVVGVVVLLLVLGWVVAGQLTDALRLSARPVDVPAERLRAEPDIGVVPRYQAVPRVVLPADDPLLRLAARTYADAVERRTGARPAVTTSGAPARLGATVVTLAADAGTGPQGYRISSGEAGLRIEAVDRRGASSALFALADRMDAGRPLLAQPSGSVVEPRLGLRMLDSGAVGVEPDPEAWRSGDDYSHNSRAFQDAVLPAAPYVDTQALAGDAEQFRAFVDHGLAQGYNAVAINGFLEYVTFSGVGDGDQVYVPGDPHRERALAMRSTFGPMLKYAHDMGMSLVLKTDMLALTSPLEDYLRRTTGGLDTENPQLWEVYAKGLEELFRTMPYVDGVMIRIGEAGTVYDVPGWDYYSRLAVTSVAGVRSMLTSFTGVGDRMDKDIVFRTWSVGVGAVGDMHTSSESYAKVLDGIDSPHLVVSTKFTLGDFYSHLPFNDTLDTGDHRRIVEFQGRREFEDFGALPNDLTVLHQEALARFLGRNPRVEGVWLWTQDGGPWRAGPMSLYLSTGFWQLYDLNAYAMGRLSWDPSGDAPALTSDWARRTFSDDPATVTAISEAMALSREAVTTGLYIGPYADQKVKALGLEPPPMIWVFEWDIVSGDSATLGTVYDLSRSRLDQAVAEGAEAVSVAERMRALVAATPVSTWRSRELHDRFVATLEYQVDLFRTLGAYRVMFLRHQQWLDTGSPEAAESWRQARSAYLEARSRHVATYSGNLDLPPYVFTAADIGLEHADRDEPMAWLARLLLAVILVLLLLGTRRGQRLLRHGTVPGAAALRSLWVGATRPWRLAELAPAAAGRTDRTLVWLLPTLLVVVSRGDYTWFAAPAHLFVVLSAWALFVVVLRLSIRARDPWLLWSGVGVAAVLRTVLLLVALSTRGAGGYWFAFWTRPTARSVYVTVAFAAFLWVLAVAWMVLRSGYGVSRRGAWGRLLVAVGVPLLVMGCVVAAIGLERALTVWNDQMALLPWGLSRILGITVYLGIPAELPTWIAILGALLAGAGVVLWWWGRARNRRPSSPLAA